MLNDKLVHCKTLIIIAMLVTGCFGNNDKEFTVEIIYKEIEQFETFGVVDEEYLIGNATHALLSDDIIYLSDAVTYSIKAFSLNGELVSEFGNAGRGPGEFARFGGLSVTDDKLIISDVGNRVVHVYHKNGTFSHTAETQWSAFPWGNGSFHSAWGFVHFDTNNDEVIDFYDAETYVHQSSVIAYEELGLPESNAISTLMGDDAGAVTWLGNKVVFAPRFYSGKLYMYDPESDELSNAQGYVLHESPVKMAKTEISGMGDFNFNIMSVIHNDESGYIMNESLYISELHDGEFIHVTRLRDEENQMHLGYETYNQDFELQHYTRLNFENQDLYLPRLKVIGFDGQHLFLLDHPDLIYKFGL